MNITLKKSYLQIGELQKVIYNFSDNRYLISIDKEKESIADERIENFKNRLTDDLIFSDIAEFIKK